LVNELFEELQRVETDMTLFFRLLASLPVESIGETTDEKTLVETLRRAIYADDAAAPDQRSHLAGWLRRYVARVRRDAVPPAERRLRMNRANPKYVLRNYLAQQAIDALEQGDASVMARLSITAPSVPPVFGLGCTTPTRSSARIRRPD
jgi:uncharacterized protein YdiU (UPF0061 family)